MKLKILLLTLLLFITNFAFAQSKKIYFSVIGRKVVTWVGRDIYVNGIYVGEDGKNNWQRYGWKNGITFGIAVDKNSNGKNIFLACGNGVMRSTDGGNNFKILTNWEITEVQRVYIDPSNSKILYLTSSYGIWKSTDYGETWIKKNEGLKITSQTYVTSMAIKKSDTKTIFAGTADGIVISRDGGEKWNSLALQGTQIHDIYIAPYDDNIIACCTEDEGIYLSKDGGKTWKQISDGLKSTTFYTFAFDPINQGTFYCGGYNTGIYKTTNYGEKWIQLENEITEKTIRALAVYPDNPNIIYAGALDFGLFRSTDGGNTFNCVAECDGRIWHLVIE